MEATSGSPLLAVAAQQHQAASRQGAGMYEPESELVTEALGLSQLSVTLRVCSLYPLAFLDSQYPRDGPPLALPRGLSHLVVTRRLSSLKALGLSQLSVSPLAFLKPW